MTQSSTLCVGTVGTGVWRSTDSGETWRQVREGLWNESRIYSLAVHPHEPQIIYAGTDDGLYRSADGGERFARVDSPLNTLQVWRIAIDPVDPQIIYAGTRPSALFRSRDGGAEWQQLTVELADECPAVRIPRVTALVVDPGDHNIVWAGIEVDGVRRSLDGGETWTHVAGGLNDPDIHDIALCPHGVLVSTPREIFVSTDTGDSWQGLGVAPHFAFRYCRGLALKADNPAVLFVATGDAATGSTGAIQRSPDGGHSWQRPALPIEPNTPIWAFATHAARPEFIAACSHYGQLFTSDDGGNTWGKVRREFSEIRALAMTVN